MEPHPSVRVALCGPVDVRLDGEPVALGGAKPRGILALLLLAQGQVVSSEVLVERLWGSGAGAKAISTLQVHVSNLRRTLAPVSEALGHEVVITRSPGYLAGFPPEAVDLLRHGQIVEQAREYVSSGRMAAAADLFDSARLLCADGPLSDLRSEEWWDDAVRPIERRLYSTVIEGLSVGLDAGRHAELLPTLESLLGADPLDEGLRGMLMLAQYRSGRQAAALASFQEGRAELIDQLGVEPGPDLRSLEDRILAQDPSLDVGSRPASQLEFTTALRSSLLVQEAEVEIDGVRTTLQVPVTTIGRRSTQHIVVDDTKASRAHATIRSEGGRYVLEDLGSTNGTFLNGRPLSGAQALMDGDTIRIGSTELVFHQSG